MGSEPQDLVFYAENNANSKTSPEQDLKSAVGKDTAQYPCILLSRNNGWNDFSWVTQFHVFYFANEDTVTTLGTIKIIQKDAIEFKTALPNKFNALAKEIYFSRGTLTFYAELSKTGHWKNKVLIALNDIHFNDITREKISKIGNPQLLLVYDESLYRNGFFSSEVTSDYAKDSKSVLQKIRKCSTALAGQQPEIQEHMRRLLFGSVIAVLESYLGDAFRYRVLHNQNYYASFLKNYEFPKADKTYNLKELGLQGDNIGSYIRKRVKEVLDEIIFHKVKLVYLLYEQILNIRLPDALADFQDDIQKRHDIFHRNGKNVLGNDVAISEYDLDQLIDRVTQFIVETEIILASKC